MKKFLVNKENPDGILVDLTAEEIAVNESDLVKGEEQAQIIATQKVNYKTNRDSLIAKLKDTLSLTDKEIEILLDYSSSSIFTSDSK